MNGFVVLLTMIQWSNLMIKKLEVTIETNGRNTLEINIIDKDKTLLGYNDQVQGINNIQIVSNAIREVFYRMIINMQQDLLLKEVKTTKKARKKPRKKPRKKS